MKKSAFIFLVVLGAFAWAFAQGPEGDAPEEESEDKHAQELSAMAHLDIIFAIDASSSVEWTDHSSFRKALAKAIVEITQDRGGDRVAVVQFAGWKETSKKGWRVFNLTRIPEEPQMRKVLCAQVKDAISERLGSFGWATDFNFAFEKAIQSVLDEREGISENKVWIVLISDGSMEVIERREEGGEEEGEEGGREGCDVRQVYDSKVAAESLPVNRINLNAAATQIFVEDVLPKIAANDDIYVSCINLGEPSELMACIGELENAQLLNTSAENLKTVLVEAFVGLPEEYGDHGITRAFGYFSSGVIPASTATNTFHIYQGAITTHVFLLGTTSNFEIDIENQMGASILGNPGVTIIGEGDSYRLISIANEAFGDYRLTTRNKSAQEAVFEFLQYAEFELAPEMGTSALKGEFEPGEALEFEVRLVDKRTSVIIKDSKLVSQARVLLYVKDVEGNVDEKILPFDGGNLAQTIAGYQLPDDAPGGEYQLEIRVAAIEETVSGRYAYLSEPEVVGFSVLSPLVELCFAQDTALIGQPVGVEGTPTKGSLTEEQKEKGVVAKVVQAVSHTEKEVHLKWDDQAKQLRGTVSLDELNEWRLKPVPLGTGQLKPVKPSWIVVKPRAIRVYATNKKGEKVPVDKITFKFKEKLEETPQANVVVETDVVLEEVAQLSVSFNTVEEAEVVDIVSGKTEFATQLTAEAPSALLSLTLRLKRQPEKKEVGELAITAKFPATSAEKKVSLIAEVPPAPFPWLYVIIAGGAIVLAALVVWSLVGGPRFDQQQLHIIGGEGHLLEEWTVGKKKAVGTLEVPGTLRFSLKGSKSAPKCVVRPGKDARVFVNNKECTSRTALSHGDYVEIHPAEDEYSYKYRYFERAPTESELRIAEEVTEQIGEGVFLGEDEFILAEDDDLTSAPGEATQALVEQARLLKQRKEQGPTEILVESRSPEELLQEAASGIGEQDVTEAVPSLPGEATEVIGAGIFEEAEGVEATQAIGAEGEAVFEEISTPEDVPDLPLSDESMESEPTQAIGSDALFGGAAGEATQAIMSEAVEPTEELGGEPETIEDLAELAEQRLEMSEFVDEDLAPPMEEDEGEVAPDLDLAEELDKTFDQILGEEEKEDEM